MISPPATAISFFVRGRPVPKGSMIVRHSHGTRLDKGCSCRQWVVPQSDERLDEWTALIATAAKRAMRGALPFDGPVRISLVFYFRRPASHTRAQRSYPYMTIPPDGDKLERAVWDALTLAAVWRDDALAQGAGHPKRYCDGLEMPGVQIEIEALPVVYAEGTIYDEHGWQTKREWR